jgi:hypothetical protein
VKLPQEKAEARGELLASVSYTPNRLLNHVREHLQVPEGKSLAPFLKVDYATVNRIELRRHLLTPGLIIAILDAVPEMTIARLRELAGMPRS